MSFSRRAEIVTRNLHSIKAVFLREEPGAALNASWESMASCLKSSLSLSAAENGRYHAR